MLLSTLGILFVSAAPPCLDCHVEATPAVVAQWKESAHGRARVPCQACHMSAAATRPDAFDHNGFRIAVVVSPLDCARCHDREAGEFAASRHSQAAQFIGSLDNVLGEGVEGGPAAALGCRQCHGSEVRALAEGELDPATWPNTGIGRVNPDGSRGSCSACHARHRFSRAQARQPENCGRCHMGPDHPQIEIYKESIHGVLFEANRGRLHLERKHWVAGKDDAEAPSCSTCHMGATPDERVTHDVGARLSWTLRPVVSVKLDRWEERRRRMQGVCEPCHAPAHTENFYRQFDAAVELYNEKFARPAQAVMDRLLAKKLRTPMPFDDPIEWTFFELWHHEGRRARMGAAMQGPDFTQWHGFYEVAKRFYTELVPQAEALSPGVTRDLVAGPLHAWRAGMKPEERKKTLDFYKARYGP